MSIFSKGFTLKMNPNRKLDVQRPQSIQQSNYHHHHMHIEDGPFKVDLGLQRAINCGVISFVTVLCMNQQIAFAASAKAPPIVESSDRCSIKAFDNFAETRAKFSQEASSGAMVEALVDLRNCDFSNLDLSTKVFSGVLLQGADLHNSKLTGVQMSRADAKGANLSNVDFTDANCYGTTFDGANLTDSQFENAILTGATFGKDSTGTWADLKGAHFEGALISTSDIGRICENPTLELVTKKNELGCRNSRK